MNQSAHDCPYCWDLLLEVDEENEIYTCENCETDFFGTTNSNGDSVVVGEV